MRKISINTILLVLSILLASSVIASWFSGRNTFEDDKIQQSSSRGRASIGKVMMLYGDTSVNQIYERALHTHYYHNELHGYPMFVLRRQILSEFWSKPAYILNLLLTELAKPELEQLKWLVWLDGDILLLNHNIPLEIFLPPEPQWSHIHALVTSDRHGLNNGVFFLRVHEWSVWLMSACVAWRLYKPGVELLFHDQTALSFLLDSDDFRNATMRVPQRWFNAYTGYRGEGHPDPLRPQTRVRPESVKEGDLLVHFAGHPSVRAERMSIWLDAIDMHLPEWEVQLDHTTYKEEIHKFWKAESKAMKRAHGKKPG